MDVRKHVVPFYSVVVILIITLGTCSTQNPSLSDLLTNSLQLSDNTPRDKRVPYSTFDPELDWSHQETDADIDHTLVNFLKRDVFSIDGGSGRFPRINRRKIIPFYQYGNEFRSYRPGPRFPGPQRYSFFVSPWKTGGYNYGNRVIRVPAGLSK